MNLLQKKITNGIFWNFSGTFFIKVFGLLSTFLILKRFGVYEYGLLELVMTVISMFSICTLVGLTDVVISDIGVEKSGGDLSKAKSLLLNFFQLQFVLSFLAWAIVFFGAHIISIYVSSNIALFLKIASFSFLISPFRTTFMVLCNVNLNFFHQSLFSSLEELAKLFFLTILFFVFNLNIEGVILARVLGEIVPLLFLLPTFLKEYKPFYGLKKYQTLPFFFLLRRHGKWSLFSRYIDTLGKNIRVWIIKVMLGTEAVGLFAIAESVFSHTSSLLPVGRVVNTIIPQYVNDKVRFYKLINKSIKYQILGYLFIGTGAFFVFPPILEILFPKYIEAIPLFLALLPTLIPVSFASVFTTMFFAYKAQSILFWAILRRVILTITITPLMILYFGIFGIAVSYFLVVSIFVFDRFSILKRLSPGFKLNIKEFFTIDEVDKLLLKKFAKK